MNLRNYLTIGATLFSLNCATQLPPGNLEILVKTTVVTRINGRIQRIQKQQIYNPQSEKAKCITEKVVYEGEDKEIVTAVYTSCDTDGNDQEDIRYVTIGSKIVALSLNAEGNCYTQKIEEKELENKECAQIQRYSEFGDHKIREITPVLAVPPIYPPVSRP